MTMAEPASILIADDDAVIRRMYTIMLERAGYEVTCVADGQAVLVQIARRMPDLLVLDYMMPYVNGLEVLNQLARKPETASLPVLLISAALTEPDLAAQPMARHMQVELAPKPVAMSDLVARVERLLHQPPIAA